MLGPGPIIQALTLGLLTGGFYGLLALGLSLIFGVIKIFNIAHGDFAVLGAYGAYWLSRLYGIGIVGSFLVVTVIFALSGVVIQRGVMKRAMSGGPDSTLIVSFGLILCLENIMTYFWTGNTRQITVLQTSFYLDGIILPSSYLYAFVASIAISVGLYLVLTRTFLGKAIRAVSIDEGAASLMGVNTRRIQEIGFSIGLALAGVAGVVLGILYPFSPTAGLYYVLIAFVVIILGGAGNPLGALVAGLLLGVVESIASLVSTSMVTLVAFAFFLLVLYLRPHGIFGRLGSV